MHQGSHIDYIVNRLKSGPAERLPIISACAKLLCAYEHQPTSDVAAPGLVLGQLALTAGFLVLLFSLIVLVESVVLQVLRWGSFKRSSARLFLDEPGLHPGLAFLVLSLVPRLGFFGLLVAWVLSVLIEWAVLARFQPGQKRYTLSLALSANLVSYLLLILPAYLSSN